MAYLALALGGCRSAPGALVPVAAAPVSREQVAQWVAATVPPEQRLHRFKWLFQDERSSAGGRGSARIAPPDSMRFDVAGPFGSGAASAAVIGDQPLWAEPPDAVKKLVPNYPLMWAMFGVARLPEPGDSLRGLADGETTAWQYANATDTVSYVRTTGQVGPARGRGAPGRQGRRPRRDDARLRRRAAHRPAGRAQRAGQAQPDLPLDRAGRLCAGDLDCSQAVGSSPRCSSPPA